MFLFARLFLVVSIHELLDTFHIHYVIYKEASTSMKHRNKQLNQMGLTVLSATHLIQLKMISMNAWLKLCLLSFESISRF